MVSSIGTNTAQNNVAQVLKDQQQRVEEQQQKNAEVQARRERDRVEASQRTEQVNQQAVNENISANGTLNSNDRKGNQVNLNI